MHSKCRKPSVIAQHQRNEDSRYDDVSQTEHREVFRSQAILQQILREDQLDWSVETLSNRHHDFRSKHLHAITHKTVSI